MSAQSGAKVVLFYGPQGAAAQSGGAIGLWPRAGGPAPVTTRRLRSGFTGRWGAAQQQIIPIEVPQAATDEARVVAGAGWGSVAPNDGRVGSQWLDQVFVDTLHGLPWIRAGKRLPYEPLALWGISTPADERSHAPWPVRGVPVEIGPLAQWALSLRGDDRKTNPWGRGKWTPLGFDVAHPGAKRGDRPQWIPWTRFSRVLNPGWGVVVPPGDPNEEAPAAVVVPIRSTYFVINSLALTLVATGEPLPASRVALDIGNDSWTWAFSASLPPWAFDAVRPTPGGDPVEVEVEINGNRYRMIIENVARTREFGSAAVQVSGRGRSAFLSDPYSPSMSFRNTIDRTAQQLAADALTTNGVSIGWAIDWGIDDWLVPAGVWSHSGTYMSAVNAIAQAAGGYVQPHPTDEVLRVLPLYPAPYWEWDSLAPDLELPSAVIQRDALNWKQRPEYNRVFVSGTVAGGILGQVTRTGTAGDLVAPMVTDPLITAAVAARRRGIAVLSQTGLIATESVRLPVLPETGIIAPGKFIRYVDGTESRSGIVRGVSVEASLSEVWQTVEVETRA